MKISFYCRHVFVNKKINNIDQQTCLLCKFHDFSLTSDVIQLNIVDFQIEELSRK